VVTGDGSVDATPDRATVALSVIVQRPTAQEAQQQSAATMSQVVRAIVAAGRSVVVLEARDRVGGRTLTHPLGNGGYAEPGGMFTGPTQDHIQALASAVGVGTFLTYNTGNSIFVGGDGRREVYPTNTPLRKEPTDPPAAPAITAAFPSSLVEAAIQLSISAVINKDKSAAEEVFRNEKRINAIELEIDEFATNLPALQQPLAVARGGGGGVPQRGQADGEFLQAGPVR